MLRPKGWVTVGNARPTLKRGRDAVATSYWDWAGPYVEVGTGFSYRFQRLVLAADYSAVRASRWARWLFYDSGQRAIYRVTRANEVYSILGHVC